MFRVIFLILILFATTDIIALQSKYSINPMAQQQLKQFESMLGEWTITDFSVDKRGKWIAGIGAD